MEWDWHDRRCIICLSEETKLSRAHLFPAFLGGFLWSRTHCRDCNSRLGHEVEAAAKHDDSFRLAIEQALAGELPDLAETFAAGQSYIHKNPEGMVRATFRGGDYRIKAETLADGTRQQGRDQAREGLEQELRRKGVADTEIAEAMRRFDEAPNGVFTEIYPGITIRHGTVERWDLSFDGEPVSDVFPAAIAFHFFALRVGTNIYQPIFDGYRAALRGESSEDRPTFVVEQGLTRGGYRAHFLVGTEQTMPHVVFRVQMFGEFIWRVHWPLMQSSTLLPSDGIGLDIAAKTVAHLPERPEREQPIAIPAQS